MTEHVSKDYEELALDLYKAADDLLDDLVSMRKYRNMTQSQLADRMGVSQSYISQIENGQKQLVSLLTDYAQEVGARVKYVIEPAEKKPNGDRQGKRFTRVFPSLAIHQRRADSTASRTQHPLSTICSTINYRFREQGPIDFLACS